MKHSDVQLLISAFADGELSHTERSIVEQHLSVCEECRDFLAEIKLVHHHIRHEAHVQVSPGFSMHVLDRLREKEETQVRWSDVETAARWTVVLLSGVAAVWIAVASVKGFDQMNAITEPAFTVTGDSAASVILLAGDESLKSNTPLTVMSK
jgi:anti-sigma factor RsiW